MAGPPYLGGEQIGRMLPMEHAVMALEAAFRAGPPAPDATAARAALPGGELLLAAAAHGPWSAARLTAPPGGTAAVLVLFDAGLRARLLLDARALAVLRAAAASALATRHLAAADAGTLVVLGAGAHARAHARAVLAVRQPGEVRVVAEDGRRAARLAEELSAEQGCAAVPGRPEDVEGADIVCACVPGALSAGPPPAPGAHVNTIDAGPPSLAGRRPYVVAEHAGVPGCDTDLHRVLTGQGAPPPGAPTLFVSAGLLAEELTLAAALAARLPA
ncbi:hypothetical protein [Nonomuraea sp. NPDC050783]|uniref:hypothetical protein n=1 Tax=Nonomuraea sp. NPDC050783 TaxID=3154634 RepID=UPI0034661701